MLASLSFASPKLQRLQIQRVMRPVARTWPANNDLAHHRRRLLALQRLDIGLCKAFASRKVLAQHGRTLYLPASTG